MSLVKTASATWDGELCFDCLTGSGHALRLDGEGNVTGASPMEMVLVGLAGCTGMDVISVLRKKREAVTGMSIRVRGVQSETHPRVFTAVELEFVVRGRAVSPQAVDRAITLSQTKYCPVSAMLGGPGRIHCSFLIEESDA